MVELYTGNDQVHLRNERERDEEETNTLSPARRLPKDQEPLFETGSRPKHSQSVQDMVSLQRKFVTQSNVQEPNVPENVPQTEAMQWRMEALRLSQRIMDLEIENAKLRATIQSFQEVDDIPAKQPNKNSAWYVAAAASHRSRARRKESGRHRQSSTRRNHLRESWSCAGFEDLKSNVSVEDAKAPARVMISASQRSELTSPARSESSGAVNRTTRERAEARTNSAALLTAPNGTASIEPDDLGNIKFWIGSWNMGAKDPFTSTTGEMLSEELRMLVAANLLTYGYDVYVLGVQEGTSSNVYTAVREYLNHNPDHMRYVRIRLQSRDFLLRDNQYPQETDVDAVRGRGDGAFMGTKFTGIAVFVSERVRSDVVLLRSVLHKFHLTSGSKGGVCVGLKVKDTTLAFVNCHLDAKHDSNRREQIRQLNAQLGKSMGQSGFDLTEQFHHVVWMGDLNYRIHTLNYQSVLDMLSAGRLEDLHNNYDGLIADRRRGVFANFREPVKYPTFYPTYKKFEQRGTIDTSDPKWPEKVYRVLYKEPFYKGGQHKHRVPGWCDRILVHSLPKCDSAFTPERIPHPSHQLAYVDNYRSINDGFGMDRSDHSPVFCTFVLRFAQFTRHGRSSRALSLNVGDSRDAISLDEMRLSHQLAGPMKLSETRLIVSNVNVIWNGECTVPKRIRIAAPLIGESDGKQPSETQSERQSKNKIYSMGASVKFQHVQPLEKLHFLLWVRSEICVGHAVIPLSRLDGIGESEDIHYKMPLTHQSSPLLHEGHPVLVAFSLRAQLVARKRSSRR